MAAYMIADIDVTDPERYAGYVKSVSPSLAKHGGRFLVRGGRTEELEGSWTPKRIVVLEFESFDRAMQWWNSEEYADPKLVRRSASRCNMIMVDGVR